MDAGSVVSGVADRLSAATVGQVKETLLAALQDERAVLLEDVDYLQVRPAAEGANWPQLHVCFDENGLHPCVY